MSKPTLEQIMHNTPKGFLPEKAEGVSAVVQFHFTGEQSGDWFLAIDNGECQVEKGATEGSRMTMTVDGGKYVDIVLGELDGMQAFMSGDILVKGDMALAMNFPGYFKMG